MRMFICAVFALTTLATLAAEPAPDGDSASLAAAKLMKTRADRGDAEAMYVLGFLAMQFGPRPTAETPRPDAAGWKALLGDTNPAAWLEKSADAGYQPAIAAVCRMGEDRLAPAALRDKSAERCQQLRAKFPKP